MPRESSGSYDGICKLERTLPTSRKEGLTTYHQHEDHPGGIPDQGAFPMEEATLETEAEEDRPTEEATPMEGGPEMTTEGATNYKVSPHQCFEEIGRPLKHSSLNGNCTVA